MGRKEIQTNKQKERNVMIRKIGIGVTCYICLLLALRSFAGCVADPAFGTPLCKIGDCSGNCQTITYSVACGQCDEGGGCGNPFTSTKTVTNGTCYILNSAGCGCNITGKGTSTQTTCGCKP